MAANAVLRFLYVEALLPVVAFTAEFTFRDLAHVHLVGSLLHLENMVVASGALEPFFLHVFLVAEHNWQGILRSKSQISAAHLLSMGAEGNHQAGQYDREDHYRFHFSPY